MKLPSPGTWRTANIDCSWMTANIDCSWRTTNIDCMTIKLQKTWLIPELGIMSDPAFNTCHRLIVPLAWLLPLISVVVFLHVIVVILQVSLPICKSVTCWLSLVVLHFFVCLFYLLFTSLFVYIDFFPRTSVVRQTLRILFSIFGHMCLPPLSFVLVCGCLRPALIGCVRCTAPVLIL